MNLKNFYIAPIKGYQYISKMLPASCRYYPTCSEYASWQFEFNVPHKAFLSSGARILRCNQFFKGGIDYPLVRYTLPRLSCLCTFNADCGKMKIKYWIVPKISTSPTQNYYVIKDFDAIKRTS